MKYLKIKDWDEWQSYRKDRGTPPWIKVYRNLFSNPKWARLTDAEKGQLTSLWILAADNNGLISSDALVLKKVAQLDSEPNLQKFIEEDWLATGCQLDAPETETETYRKETETKTERELLSIFKNKIINEEMKKFAEDKNVFGKQLETSWQRFLIKKGNAMIERKCSYEQFFADWQLWILNERVEDAPQKEEKSLTGDELLAQQLGTVVWLRERKMFVTAKQEKDFTLFEELSGIKVTWRNNREWKEQGAVPLNYENIKDKSI